MIKFFRKIRQRLLTENKFSKYLIYAIGEIVLVVIGILIALQINNLNNNKQLRNIEQEYLISLQSEFKTNLKKINNCISLNEKLINSTEVMLSLFDTDVLDTISHKEVSNIIYSVFSTEATYNPSKGVLTDIISSGNLNLIQNNELRQQLASIESELDFLDLQEKSAHNRKDLLRSQLLENGSLRKILLDRGQNFEHKSISDIINNKQMFSSIEFENQLLAYYLIIKAANGTRFFNGIKEQIEQILIVFDSEIKK